MNATWLIQTQKRCDLVIVVLVERCRGGAVGGLFFVIDSIAAYYLGYTIYIVIVIAAATGAEWLRL